MPTKNEGERGRNQHLAVEILPPRVILYIRKIQAVGKPLPSLLRGAAEACGSAACEGWMWGPRPELGNHNHSHTQSCFHSQGELSKSSGA